MCSCFPFRGKSINHPVSRAQLEAKFPCAGRFWIHFRRELRCATHTCLLIMFQGSIQKGKVVIGGVSLLSTWSLLLLSGGVSSSLLPLKHLSMAGWLFNEHLARFLTLWESSCLQTGLLRGTGGRSCWNQCWNPAESCLSQDCATNTLCKAAHEGFHQLSREQYFFQIKIDCLSQQGRGDYPRQLLGVNAQDPYVGSALDNWYFWNPYLFVF